MAHASGGTFVEQDASLAGLLRKGSLVSRVPELANGADTVSLSASRSCQPSAVFRRQISNPVAG